jgi:hypothetical protein
MVFWYRSKTLALLRPNIQSKPFSFFFWGGGGGTRMASLCFFDYIVVYSHKSHDMPFHSKVITYYIQIKLLLLHSPLLLSFC